MMKGNFFRRKTFFSIFSAFLAMIFSLTVFSVENGQDKGEKNIWEELSDTYFQGSIPPEAELLQAIRKALPSWAANSSRIYTEKFYNGPPAWQLILNHPTGKRAAKETNIRNGFLLIYMVQARANVFPERLKDSFNWELPESELELFTVYLGKTEGYYWFVKGDLFHINTLRNAFKFKDGENFQKIMAKALNIMDFDHFTARTAILYFKDRKDDSPVYIHKAMEEWKKEKLDPPYQHLEAIKLCGGKTAGKILTQIAVSKDRGLARKAIDCLLESPELAEEKFLKRLIYLPEYTTSVLEIFSKRNKLSLILPDLEKIIERPRSIMQYAVSVEAHRKISRKLLTVPEINAASHIRLRMVRLGDTKDSSKFVPLDDSGATHLTEKVERKRIEPFVNVIIRSRDIEAAVAASLLLASLDQGNEQFLSTEYIRRVHSVGIELLQALPPDKIQIILERLDKHIKEDKSRMYMEKVMKELGIRQ
ncbi:MAG: hypothetical protein IKA79_01150 [Lentisphaeria bacterium]|nr:hypothetical protein [Lentisphaeria bacterium]